MKLEHGIISTHGPSQQRRCYLEVLDEAGQKTSEEIGFQPNGLRLLNLVDGEPVFDDRSWELVDVMTPLPETGNEVVFTRAMSETGEIAFPWGYADRLDRLQPSWRRPSYYRLRRTAGTQEEIAFEGTAAALSKQYPLRLAAGKLVDPLASGGDAPYILEMSVWDRETPSGRAQQSWQPCADPRPQPGS